MPARIFRAGFFMSEPLCSTSSPVPR